MRLPFTQLANEVAEQHGPVLSEALGINLMEAIGGIAYLHHLAVANCPDDCPPSEAPPFTGAAARTLEARLCWKGPGRPAGQWLLAAQELGLVVVEGDAASPTSIRVRGLHRYDATYKEREAARQRRDVARERAKVRRTVGEPSATVPGTVASETHKESEKEKDTHMHAVPDRARARDVDDDWPDVPEADPLDVRPVTPGERLAGALQAAGNGPPSDTKATAKGKVAPGAADAREAVQEAATSAVRFFGHCVDVCEAKGRAWDGPGNAGREAGVRWYNGAIRDLLDAQKRRGEALDGPKADAQLRAGYAAFAASTDDWLQRNGWPWAAFAKGFAKWACAPAPVDKWKGKPGWEPPAQTSA